MYFVPKAPLTYLTPPSFYINFISLSEYVKSVYNTAREYFRIIIGISIIPQINEANVSCQVTLRLKPGSNVSQSIMRKYFLALL